MSCQFKGQTLAYLRGQEDSTEIESHIEQCVECSALVEGYMEKEQEIELPKQDYEGEKDLKEHVIKYEKGTRRIVVFSIVGLIMGAMSHRYLQDHFIVTKVILGLPYKINEIIHTTLHEYTISQWDAIGWDMAIDGMNFNVFFPQDGLASMLAEYITPILIAAAIYGSLAFFTGDSRIFTLKKYLKFAMSWVIVIALWIVGTFALNHYSTQHNNELKDVTGFFLYAKDHGSGYYSDEREGAYKVLIDAFYGEQESLQEITSPDRSKGKEYAIELFFGKSHARRMVAIINPEEKYLITDQLKCYQISEEFADLVKAYGEGGDITPDVKEIKIEQRESSYNEEVAD